MSRPSNRRVGSLRFTGRVAMNIDERHLGMVPRGLNQEIPHARWRARTTTSSAWRCRFVFSAGVRSSELDRAAPELDDVAADEDPLSCIDFQEESRWTICVFTLGDLETLRQRAFGGDHPPAEICSGRAGRRVFEDRATLRKEEPADQLLRRILREDISHAVSVLAANGCEFGG